MELLDSKSTTKFDMFSSVLGTYDMINFWQSLPSKNFLELRIFAQIICMLFWNNVHMQTSIFVHEIDQKKNEVVPDW